MCKIFTAIIAYVQLAPVRELATATRAPAHEHVSIAPGLGITFLALGALPGLVRKLALVQPITDT